jgi:ADP-ribose pyrophosphatase YjhB (NUDIX family)
VLEETGLTVDAHSFFTIFERIVPDVDGRCEYHYVLVDYICRVMGGEPCAASDVAAVAWALRDEVNGYRLTDGTLGVIMRAYESGAHIDDR